MIEIITGRERRRRWSVAEKPRIVAESQEPGARVCDVAARYDVSPSLLYG
jgi:transposase